MKIKTKLTLSVGLLFFMIALLAAIGAKQVNSLASDSKNILQDNYNTLDYSRNMLKSLDELNSERNALQIFESNLKKQAENITEVGEAEYTNNLSTHFEQLKANRFDTLAAEKIRRDINDIMKLNMDAIQRKSNIAANTARNATIWITITGTLCFLIAFSLLVNLPGSIANPIRELTGSIKAIAAKNYSQRVNFKKGSEFAELADSFNIMAQKLEEYNNSSLAKLMMEKKRVETLINNKNEKKIELTNRKRELINWYNELKDENLSPVVHKLGEDKIDTVYRKLKNENREKNELKANKDEAFMNLKLKVDSNLASERDFIKHMEDEIATIQNKEEAIDTLLQSVANDFSIPTLELLNKFRDFKEFVRKFNTHLSNYTVSNIERISINVNDNERLINDLQKIGSIQAIPKDLLLLNFNKPDNIVILDRYLKYSRKVEFKEMFELIVEITKNGKKERVDISKQIESDGTDRMIKLFIFLTLIKWMVVDNEENKLVIYIDEGGQFGINNRKEIIRFCKENNIVPIFAAPDGIVLPDLEKYYFLIPDAGGKVVVNETRAINAKAFAN